MSSFTNKYNASKKSFVHSHTHSHAHTRTHTHTRTHAHLKNDNPNKNVCLTYFSVVKNSSVKIATNLKVGFQQKKGELGCATYVWLFQTFLRNIWLRFLLLLYFQLSIFRFSIFFPLAGRQYCIRFVYHAMACIEKQFTPGKQFPHTVHVYAKTVYPSEDIQ